MNAMGKQQLALGGFSGSDNIQALAELFNVSISTIYSWIREGKLLNEIQALKQQFLQLSAQIYYSELLNQPSYQMMARKIYK